MKLTTHVLPFLASFALCLPILAANKKTDSDHGHSHAKKEAGPNGGRLLVALEPHAEFLVTADRKVQITFLDRNDKPVAPAEQVVMVTAGQRSSPTKLAFVRSGDVLVSNVALPAGNDFPTVVQIKLTPTAKWVTEKFNLNLSKCPDCANAEYACTCDDH